MAKTLLEAYQNRIKVAESVYAKSHDGEAMDVNKKVLLARCLENTRTFMNESVAPENGTQVANMGLWKKFCTNLINVAVPNLIASDLVITKPMSSMSGYITYVKYSAATTKGETTNGDVFNTPFALGEMKSEYTGDAVTEPVTTAGSSVVLGWTPVMKGIFENEGTKYDVKIVKAADGTVTYANVGDDGKTVTATVAVGDKVYYRYDNVVVPQNDLPRIKAEMVSIPLVAKARRIAIYYSQMAAFQSKTDYGFDLGDSLAEQACGRLQYEIDTEVVELLDKTAGTTPHADLVWSKTLPVGVSKMEHYMGFVEAIEVAKRIIYTRTQRFVPNYMIISPEVLSVLTFINGWKAASTNNINGPYLAGTLNGLKVFVSPALKAGRYLIGVNGNDYMSAVAAYCPYMPLVPTQLLQFADGATSQGFSTLYDLVVLNDQLIVAGQVEGTGI